MKSKGGFGWTSSDGSIPCYSNSERGGMRRGGLESSDVSSFTPASVLCKVLCPASDSPGELVKLKLFKFPPRGLDLEGLAWDRVPRSKQPSKDAAATPCIRLREASPLEGEWGHFPAPGGESGRLFWKLLLFIALANRDGCALQLPVGLGPPRAPFSSAWLRLSSQVG